MAWETTSTSSPARRARSSDLSSSSVLPANIGPTITCRRPAKVADMRPGYAAARRRYGTAHGNDHAVAERAHLGQDLTAAPELCRRSLRRALQDPGRSGGRTEERRVGKE